jgi:hypothetical protein
VVALSLVGTGAFCIGKGIAFWVLPRQEASSLGVDLLGLHINAAGLGGVVFAAGIAICFIAYKAAPRRLEEAGESSSGHIESSAGTTVSPEASPPSARSGETRGGGGGTLHQKWANKVDAPFK